MVPEARDSEIYRILLHIIIRSKLLICSYTCVYTFFRRNYYYLNSYASSRSWIGFQMDVGIANKLTERVNMNCLNTDSIREVMERSNP